MPSSKHRDRVVKLFDEGYSVFEVMSRMGLSEKQARYYQKIHTGCGLPANLKGPDYDKLRSVFDGRIMKITDLDSCIRNMFGLIINQNSLLLVARRMGFRYSRSINGWIQEGTESRVISDLEYVSGIMDTALEETKKVLADIGWLVYSERHQAVVEIIATDPETEETHEASYDGSRCAERRGEPVDQIVKQIQDNLMIQLGFDIVEPNNAEEI